jgi:hypothetical protein
MDRGQCTGTRFDSNDSPETQTRNIAGNNHGRDPARSVLRFELAFSCWAGDRRPVDEVKPAYRE